MERTRDVEKVRRRRRKQKRGVGVSDGRYIAATLAERGLARANILNYKMESFRGGGPENKPPGPGRTITGSINCWWHESLAVEGL